jgi:dynein heavy chain
VQRNWQRLEPIFVGSDDIRAQLPEDTKRFEKVDNEWKDLMREARDEPMVVNACTADGREELLNTFNSEIETCEKALNDYLQAKKKIFARFYFVSDQALLDILSNGNNPEKVDEYIGDCFDGLKCVKFLPEGPRPYKTCVGMHAKDQEFVPFSTNFAFVGVVENYLCDLEAKMISTLKEILDAAKITADNWEYEKPRHIWLEDYCAQISLLTTQIMWTEETARAFDDLDGGSETAMKDYGQTTILRINKLIERVRTDLTKDLRDKIITIITIDVHERDVVIEMVDKKIVESSHFKWQSQLKFYMESKEPRDVKKVCNSKICDWSTWYNYEYVGNCGRLVITPLTDRCYITLTQALNLSMGGAPAGPAGTGKTETTKDLGRALGLQVVVFNCSDQMNYMSMSLIFMGLA